MVYVELIIKKEIEMNDLNRKKVINWNEFNHVDIKEIMFFFNNKKDIGDSSALDEIYESSEAQIKEYVCSDAGYVNWTVTCDQYGVNGFLMKYEFSNPVHFHETNSFLKIMKTIFTNKFKKFQYDGFEFGLDKPLNIHELESSTIH